MKKILTLLALTVCISSAVAVNIKDQKPSKLGNVSTDALPSSLTIKRNIGAPLIASHTPGCYYVCQNDLDYCLSHGGTIQSCFPEYSDCLDLCATGF
jgi:hypothetical protein